MNESENEIQDMTADDQQEILKARAARLARRRDPPQSVSLLDVVCFSLGLEDYAVESRYVREVSSLRELTPLPGLPAFVLGIINVRGRIVSVIDIRRFFELEAGSLPDLDKVIVIQSGDMEVAILASKLLGYWRIPGDDVQPPLPTWNGVRADYLRGVTGNRLVVLDVARLLGDERIVVRGKAASQTAM